MFFQAQYVLRDANVAEGEAIELSKDKPYPVRFRSAALLPAKIPATGTGAHSEMADRTSGHHNPIRNTRGLRWSDDGQKWKPVPGQLKFLIEFGLLNCPTAILFVPHLPALVLRAPLNLRGHRVSYLNSVAESCQDYLLNLGLKSRKIGERCS
jgi:hypothetical protein